MKSLFLDTNIAIDLLAKREPFYSAVESGIDTIITRNVKDFRNANASVMTPEDYLQSCH